MPETTILNPSSTWEDDIQDNYSPDYGFTRSRPSTRAVAKPAGGRPWSIETSNSGHTFSLSWLNRSWLCAQRLKQFYEQFEDGFFTLVDRDGGGRHYVGRFTGEFPINQTGNDRYDIQGLTFEEIPGCPMMQYPDDWERDGITLRAANDFGDMMCPVSGTWLQTTLVSADGLTLSTLYNSGNAGEWCAYEYRGYGFRLYMVQGPSSGRVRVYLDGEDLGIIDLYAAQDNGAQIALERASVPLDLHRVKIVVVGDKNAASSSAAVTFSMLEVMR